MTITSKFITTLSLVAIVACAPAGEAERTGDWALSPLESDI